MPPTSLPPAAAAPWRALLTTHLTQTTTTSLSFTTIQLHNDPTNTHNTIASPRTRTCEFRGFWPTPTLHPSAITALESQGIGQNPALYESDMISLTTDVRMAKVDQLASSQNRVEAAFWFKDVASQWRVKGRAYVIGDPERGEAEEEARRLVWRGMRMARDMDLKGNEDEDEGEEKWTWERQVTTYFANHSPVMRGSFKNPPPGQPRSQVPSDPELRLGQTVDDLHDPVARRNFRVVVIYPEEVEHLDLSDYANVCRTCWTFKDDGGENGGNWEEVELWP